MAQQMQQQINLVIHDEHGKQQTINVRPSTQKTIISPIKTNQPQQAFLTPPFGQRNFNVANKAGRSSFPMSANIKVEQITNTGSQPRQPHYSAASKASRKSMPSTMTSHQFEQSTSTAWSTPSQSPIPAGGSFSSSKKKKSDKVGKGLRHFSWKVCQKVREKGATTYNEVADELVAEETLGQSMEGASYDQKNIRRRVYDALNVLMAMNIISKEKKEIRWIGLQTPPIQECEEAEKANMEARIRIQEKQQMLRDLIFKGVTVASLCERNKDLENRGIIPSSNSAVQLPFLAVNTNKKTHINCSISNDKREYSFKFDNKFEVYDDSEVLKRMGLLFGLEKGECALDDLNKLKKLMPANFRYFLESYAQGIKESNPQTHEMLPEEIEEQWEILLDDASELRTNGSSQPYHDLSFIKLEQEPEMMEEYDDDL